MTKLLLFIIFENMLLVVRQAVKASVSGVPAHLPELQARNDLTVDRVFREVLPPGEYHGDVEEELDLTIHTHRGRTLQSFSRNGTSARDGQQANPIVEDDGSSVEMANVSRSDASSHSDV